MTSDIWNEARLNQMIKDEIEESLNLDYKAAGSLEKSDKKKTEITKDISAMANSAGGVIIYGISEFQQKDRGHFPEKIDPVDRKSFPKEWIEQVVGNIQPRITGIIIHPVPISSHPDHVAYVIEIPRSTTAHQARDQKYYRRFNFESVAMYDYEIRDVMNRLTTARFNMKFHLKYYQHDPNKDIFGMPEISMPFQSPKPRKPVEDRVVIEAILDNVGTVLAQNIVAFYRLPRELVSRRELSNARLWRENPDYVEIRGENREYGSMGNALRTVVILPGLDFHFSSTGLDYRKITNNLNDLSSPESTFQIHWEIYADNAPAQIGVTPLSEIIRATN